MTLGEFRKLKGGEILSLRSAPSALMWDYAFGNFDRIPSSGQIFLVTRSRKGSVDVKFVDSFSMPFNGVIFETMSVMIEYLETV